MSLSGSITPLILTYDEAPNIGRTLSRLQWAHRVVVLDSGSTDQTVSIAQSYPNVEVFERPFDSHQAQWNAGLALVQTPWVLALDADFVLSRDVVGEIARLDLQAGPVGYDARFVYCVDGRPLRKTLYPSKTVLFQTASGRYTQDGHTQQLQLDGAVSAFEHVIYHDDRKPLERWLRNQTGYVALEADKLAAADPATLGLADRLRQRGLAPLVVPLYCLVGQGLLLDGRAGIRYALERTYAELLLALELSERRRGRSRSTPQDHAP